MDCTVCWNSVDCCTCSQVIKNVYKTDLRGKEIAKVVKKAADKYFKQEAEGRGYDVKTLLKTRRGKMWYKEIYDAENFAYNTAINKKDSTNDDKLRTLPHLLAKFAMTIGDLKPTKAYLYSIRATLTSTEHQAILKRIT